MLNRTGRDGIEGIINKTCQRITQTFLWKNLGFLRWTRRKD